MFPAIPEDLSVLSDVELEALETELVAAFNDATADNAVLSDEDLASFSGVADALDTIRATQGTRHEAATARAEQLASLAERVNAAAAEAEPEIEEPVVEPEPEVEPEVTPEVTEPVVEPVVEPEKELVTASTPATPTKAKSVTAAANTAQLKARQPIRTRPRAEAPADVMSIIASVDVPGVTPGQSIEGGLAKVAELLSERHRTIGRGNGDSVPVVQFQANYPEDRKLSKDMDPDKIQRRIESFDRTPNGIQAAGGLCAPVNSYYGQMVIAGAARPVRDGLANFQADRGGIKYNPPPKLSDLTGGIAVVTAAQDLAGTTKTPFTATCNAAVEVDVAAVYNSIKFGNFGTRAFPEAVEAWTKLGLSVQARTAETLLLDGIAAASTSVTASGQVGAGRELFARLGQGAAGFRSRNRMSPDVTIKVMLPAWTLDLVQADFARTFTDESGLIQMDDSDIEKLFGTRNLSVSWYLDSKTGGGQIWGAISGGRSVADGATNSNTTVTSATGAFTAADINKVITGTGIPAGTTITAVASGTSVTISAAATTTATGLTLGIGSNVLREFPTTVFAYMFAEGSFLHLDAGTLDVGLVRDSSLLSTNQFQMFTESFENVALIGPESLEIALNLTPDGSYAAARSISRPIND